VTTSRVGPAVADLLTDAGEPLTVEQLRERYTITPEEAGRVVGIGRTAAYDALRRGELPSLRIGRRLLVPTALLLRLLGHDERPAVEDGPGDDVETPLSGPLAAGPDVSADARSVNRSDNRSP
jgi:excisionase family DNA binding protein